MRLLATIRWVALALLGLLIAGGVAIAASSLASQQIGLASEPISAGNALAPAVVRTQVKPHRHRTSTSHSEATPGASTVPVAPIPPTPPTVTAAPAQPVVPPSTATPVPASPGHRSGEDGGGGRGGGEGGHADD